MVDGRSIGIALSNYPNEFQSLGMTCEAVVCCRLTPLQKSEASFMLDINCLRTIAIRRLMSNENVSRHE